MPSHLTIPVSVGGSNLLTPASSLTLVNGENNSGNFSFSELEGRDSAEQVQKLIIYFNNINIHPYLNIARDPQ